MSDLRVTADGRELTADGHRLCRTGHVRRATARNPGSSPRLITRGAELTSWEIQMDIADIATSEYVAVDADERLGKVRSDRKSVV